MRKSVSGFTLVELLIVVAVIVILSTVAVLGYSQARTNAQASAIAADLKATEQALHTFKTLSGNGDWWIDTDADLSGTTSGNPTINSIISAQPEFYKLLKKAPTKDGLVTPNNWFYDNDGDTYGGCSASTAGISLMIYNPQNSKLVQAVDDAIDDGDLSCGRVRIAGGNFVYGLE